MSAMARRPRTALAAACLGALLATSSGGEAAAGERGARLTVRVEVVQRCLVARRGAAAVIDPACARAAAPTLAVQDRAGATIAADAVGPDGARYLTVIY